MLLLALASCSRANLGSAPFLCNLGGTECPSGYVCHRSPEANVCVKQGECPAGVRGCPDAGQVARDSGADGPLARLDAWPDIRPDLRLNDIGAPDDAGLSTCQVNGETTCGSEPDDLLKCRGGEWVLENCLERCTLDGYEYSAGCRLDAKTSKYACACGTFQGYGKLCDATRRCKLPLVCLLPPWSTTTGFCTKACDGTKGSCDGTGFGNVAYCIMKATDNKTFCAYVCKPAAVGWCPDGYKCDSDGVCKY